MRHLQIIIQHHFRGHQISTFDHNFSDSSKKLYGEIFTPLTSSTNKKSYRLKDYPNTYLSMRPGLDTHRPKKKAKESIWSKTKSLITRSDSEESSTFTICVMLTWKKDSTWEGMNGIRCSTPTIWTKDIWCLGKKFPVIDVFIVDIE